MLFLEIKHRSNSERRQQCNSLKLCNAVAHMTPFPSNVAQNVEQSRAKPTTLHPSFEYNYQVFVVE